LRLVLCVAAVWAVSRYVLFQGLRKFRIHKCIRSSTRMLRFQDETPPLAHACAARWCRKAMGASPASRA
jgi:hypothetical protein